MSGSELNANANASSRGKYDACHAPNEEITRDIDPRILMTLMREATATELFRMKIEDIIQLKLTAEALISAAVLVIEKNASQSALQLANEVAQSEAPALVIATDTEATEEIVASDKKRSRSQTPVSESHEEFERDAKRPCSSDDANEAHVTTKDSIERPALDLKQDHALPVATIAAATAAVTATVALPAAQSCIVCHGLCKRDLRYCHSCYCALWQDARRVVDARARRTDSSWLKGEKHTVLETFISEVVTVGRLCPSELKCPPSAYASTLQTGSRCTRCRTLACIRLLPDLAYRLLMSAFDASSTEHAQAASSKASAPVSIPARTAPEVQATKASVNVPSTQSISAAPAMWSADINQFVPQSADLNAMMMQWSMMYPMMRAQMMPMAMQAGPALWPMSSAAMPSASSQFPKAQLSQQDKRFCIYSNHDLEMLASQANDRKHSSAGDT